MSGVKCIGKIRLLAAALLASILLGGCGGTSTAVSYDLDTTSSRYGLIKTTSEKTDFFSSGLCVTQQDNFGLEQVDSQVAGGAGVFNLTTGNCAYAQNIFGTMYPASTTKILTCMTALEYGDLNSSITVSEYAADQASDSSVANLEAGDVMSLHDLLYGLMLRSGNDAAIAIAEGVAGSVENFADLMNAKALSLGATHSHFVTPHGLHDDDHYTTIYDMYLIFQEAIRDERFLAIAGSSEYHVVYTGGDGAPKEQDWRNTNQYLSGAKRAPEGFQVVCGKTGTTYEAGYCLVLYSKNPQGQDIVSIVYNADCSLNLYYLMNELLYTFGEAHAVM